MITKKIGVIGCGNMGGAILYGALESGVLPKENVYVYDINPAMMEKAKGWGVNLAKDDEDVCLSSDIILLAVKPQNAAEALSQCKKALDGRAMMSIVAGVTVERLRNMIDGTPRILRLLPNTPAMVKEGMMGMCPGETLTDDEVALVRELCQGFSKTELIAENLMDVVTAVSGSSPAYVFMFIEAMADAAVAGGMPRAQAYTFAAQAVMGSAKMVLETGKHPGELKDMVCSPAGTTIEAVRVLEDKGMRSAVIEAMMKCLDISRNM